MLNTLESLLRYQHWVTFTGALMTGLTTAAVALRLLSRWMNDAKLGLDDGFIIAAQLLWYPMYALGLTAVIEGRKATSLLDPQLVKFTKFAYMWGEFYLPIALLTNLSILSFYSRIFGVNRKFRRLAAILMGVQVLWFIPGFITETVSCSPPSILWERPLEIPNKCIYLSTFVLVIVGVEILLQVIILALPLTEIVKLQLSWQKKVVISLVFLLGGFVVVTDIIRLIVIYTPGQQFVDLTLDMIWLNIHLGTAIICACLPTYRSLITKSFSSIRLRLASKPSASPKSSKWTSGPSKQSGRLDGTTGSGSYQFSGDNVQLVDVKSLAMSGMRGEREREVV